MYQTLKVTVHKFESLSEITEKLVVKQLSSPTGVQPLSNSHMF